jgi:hypothetical protein
MDHLFTLPDAWDGGGYELAIEYRAGTAERALAGIAALWAHPQVGRCYLCSEVEPERQSDVDPRALQLGDRAYGACVLNGVTVAAAFVSIPYDHGPIWLYFGFPMVLLGRAYRVGAYPFDDGSSLVWRDDVDVWLRDIGVHVFGRAPFDCALISWEPEEDVADIIADGEVPAQRWQGILVPGPSGLAWHPPTEGFPCTFDR